MDFRLQAARRFARRTLCTAALLLLVPAAAYAETLRASVGDLGPMATPAIVEALTIAGTKVPGVSLQITVAPFARSIASVGAGSADLHVPMIRPPHEEGLSWTASTATMYHVPFVLYSNKDKPLDLGNLGKYKIETDAGHVGYFEFPALGSAGVESSLQKLAAGRIDGYVYAANVTDPALEKLGLKNIHRDFYRMFDAVAVLPMGGRGGPADQWFTQAMAAVGDDAAFKAAAQKLLGGYKGPDWQP